MDISNPFFAGDTPIPFEIIIKDNGLTLFEQEVKEKLNTLIDKGGCKFQHAHIKLGSKVHLKDFYYAEKLFQDSYYAIRFAYLTSQYISQELKSTPDKITILGYGIYSELLVSNVARFLNEIEKNNLKKRQFNHSIIEDVEDLKLLTPLNPQVILVVPIGSTLTTQLKIYRKLQREMKIDFVLNPICILVIGHKKIEEITNPEGKIVNGSFAKKFWEKVNLDKKEIYLADLSEEEGEKIGKARYFVYLPSEWHLPHDCKYCWEEGKPLFYTNKVSVTPQTIFGIPNAKKKETTSFELSFQSSNKENNKAIITPELLKYGHFQRGTNHYLFYIDTNKFYDKNKAVIKKWLERVKKKLKEGHQDLFEKPCVLIAPTHETNVDFINLVNEQIFNDAAHVVHFDPLSEYEQNFQYLFQKTFQSSPYVFFVDDALCTGKTLHRVQEFFRRLGINKDITGYLVMINRLPVKTYQNDNNEVGNIYSFTHLEAPVMEGIKEKCYLCREESRYEEVLKNTIVDALREKIYDKLNSKLNPHKKKKASSSDSESREVRHLKRLELTHKLYHKLHELSNIEEFVNQISEGDRETKINLVKTLSQPPFIYYKEVRKKIYPFLLEELNDVVEC